jgi:hypothetical protein
VSCASSFVTCSPSCTLGEQGGMYKGDQLVCMCVFCVLLEAHCVWVVIAFEFFFISNGPLGVV